MAIKIKSKYKTVIVGFGKFPNTPLGQRSDIEELALLAKKSGNPNLLRFFEEVPPIKDLRAKKDRQFMKETEKLNAKLKKAKKQTDIIIKPEQEEKPAESEATTATDTAQEDIAIL